MRWSDLPLNPSTRMLREFAALSIAVFGGLALWQWLVHGDVRAAVLLGALAASLGVGGLLFPKAIRPVFVVWLVLAFPIGWVVSRVLIALLFVGVICPIGAMFRAFGRDVLHVRRSHSASYWLPKPAARDLASYFRQF